MPIARQTVLGSPVEINTLKLGNCSALSSANHSSHPRAARISDRSRSIRSPSTPKGSFVQSLGSARLGLGNSLFLSIDSIRSRMNRCVCVCGNERNLYEFVFESTRVVYYRYPRSFPSVCNGKLLVIRIE